MRHLFLATAFVVGVVGSTLASGGDTVLLAQGKSCKSWLDMCSQRCKVRAPTDKNCVSDHCSPKFATCKQDGCWQEGNLYGGQRHCGLSR